jgi:hypothetical protein
MGKGRIFRTCDDRSENGNMGTEDRCADLYDKSRRTAALTVGAHGTQKETEDDESEKNGRGERERADNHAEAGLMDERGQRLLASRNLSISSPTRST